MIDPPAGGGENGSLPQSLSKLGICQRELLAMLIPVAFGLSWMEMSIILLRIALLCYGVGFLVTFVPLLTGGGRAVNVTPWLAGVGAVAHTAAVVAIR